MRTIYNKAVFGTCHRNVKATAVFFDGFRPVGDGFGGWIAVYAYIYEIAVACFQSFCGMNGGKRNAIVGIRFVKDVAALKCAIRNLADRYHCKAAAIQCWNALQGVLGIFPCAANALLTDERFPVTCETDIHGAITAIMAQAASLEDNVTFFADWTVPHPTNDNAELLQHCGPWPISLMKEKPKLGAPFAFNHSHPGSLHGEIKEGQVSILRFDGDNGEYSMLMGEAHTVEGPFNQGTYVWIEVDNLKKLEDKLVRGPYVHHCVGIYENVLPQIYDACHYIDGLSPDPYDRDEEALAAIIRGE